MLKPMKSMVKNKNYTVKNMYNETAILTERNGRSVFTSKSIGECENCGTPLSVIRYKDVEGIYKPCIMIKCKKCRGS